MHKKLLAPIMITVGLASSCSALPLAETVEASPTTIIIPDAMTGSVNSVAEKTLASTVSIITETSSGSGFIISENKILTAFHVVSGAEEITITFQNGITRTGTIEVSDYDLDIAVMTLDKPVDVPALKLARIENIRLGDFVLAVGSPLGLDSSVSTGIISNIERNSLFQNPLQRNLIQTDAAVNPGNSGGPLVNLNGDVVGIIQLRPDVAGDRLVTGVGLALRSDAIGSGLKQLYEYGNISYPRIGITGRAANPEDAIYPGVVVETVEEGSPAAEANIAEGDTVTSLDGNPVDSLEEVLTLLWDYRAGDKITLETQDGNREVLLAEYGS